MIKKNNQKLMIIFVGECILFSIILIFGIIYILNKTYVDKNFINDFQCRKDTLYLDDEYCYYNNHIFKNSKNVICIDDTSYIYLDDGDYYLDNGEIVNKILSNNIQINYGSLFMKNGFLYFKNINGFFNYDINHNIINKIEKDYYYKMKDGEIYSIDSTEIDSSILYFKKTNEGLIKRISYYDIIKNDYLNKICRVSAFRRIDGYTIIDDHIYIHCSFKNYGVTLEYNFETEELSLYDWFNKSSSSIYLSFIGYVNDNHPLVNIHLEGIIHTGK